jgi:peptidoglycan pentaglycine glycine transferase (the first glycine)
MNVEFLKPDWAEDLARFVAGHPQGMIEQTWEWGELQTSIPGRNAMFVLAVLDGEKILASMLLIRQHMGKGKYWLWCPGGPLLPKKGAELGAEKAWRMLRDECRDLARREGDVFMRIESNYQVGEMDFGGRIVKECYLPRNSLLVDLGVKEETILGQMKQKGRYNIKKAKKAGVYVRMDDGQDLGEFYEILKETAERDGFHLHDREFYELFLDVLGEKARFYVARCEDEMLGGVLAVHFGDRATYYFGASSNASRRKMAPYALQWFAMQEAKKDGCVVYDFLGVAPDRPERSFLKKEHVLSGVTQFKTRFGGERVEYEAARVFVYRPVWWWVYRLVKWLK